MKEAVDAVYSPFVQGAFRNTKAKKYQSAYTALKAAVETLDANEMAGGLDSTKAIMNSYAPSNEGKSYTDADYSFFGVADYEPYTYYNYRAEVKEANRMINRAETPDAEGKTYPADSLTVTYRNHRLSLYGSRLLKKDALKTHLAYELANAQAKGYNSANYTADSWAAYQTALNFATSVNNDASSDLRQTKVNTAYEMLLEYQKRLIEAGGATPTTPTYEVISDAQVVETTGGKVLAGVFGEEKYGADHYFTKLENCTLEVNNNGNGIFSTGAVINVKDSTGKVIETYTVAVTNDLNGDGVSDSNDTSAISIVGTGLGVFEEAYLSVAADMNGDNIIDSGDSKNSNMVAVGVAVVDYVNRTIA